MTDNEFAKAMDLCEKLDFFGGQRAGRELWFEKPVDVQDRDIKQFVEDVAFLKDFIKRQKAEIERLKAMIEAAEDHYYPLPFKGIFDEKIKEARVEAIKEFAERVERYIDPGHLRPPAEICFSELDVVSIVKRLVKEMTEETP